MRRVILAAALVLAPTPAFADHDYHDEPRCYEGECSSQEYDQWESDQRNHNRRNRGAFSPGPFEDSPIDFRDNCISLDCGGREKKGEME